MPDKTRIACVLALFATLFACRGTSHYPYERTARERQLFHTLNDSMQQLAPHATADILRAMDEATDSLTWYDYYLMYGRRHLLGTTPDSVVGYADRTLAFALNTEPQTPRTRGLAAYALNAKGAFHYLLHQRSDADIQLFKQAYRLLKESDMKESLPDVAANIGDAYVANGLLPEGSRWYRRALYLTDSLALPRTNTLSLYMGIGRIYTTIGDFDQAREYYEMTDRRFSEMKPNMQSYFLNNYGNYFYFTRQYDRALALFQRMRDHLVRHGAEGNFDWYLCTINMADVYLNLGQTDSARHCVAVAEDYFRRHNVDVGIYYAHTIRIGIALAEHRYDEVRQILRVADTLDVSDLDMKSIRNRYLNRYYAAIGDYQRAYAGLRINIEQHDSTEQKRKQMRSADIMTRLTEDTIRLHHQLQLQEQEIRYDRHRILLLSVISILMVIILVFVLWLNHERRSKLKASIDMLNLKMKNSRLRISPHFVFNILNSRIHKSDQQEADQLLMLAKLIRTNLDLTQRENVSLAEELDFVRQYVAIERMLIGKDFTFEVTTPDDATLRQIRIPSMLVQILVENAILHGLRHQEGAKALRISVEADASETRITVSDNGPGFDVRQYNSERSRTGLTIIRNTVNIINERNKPLKMRFFIRNEGGCQAHLVIPRDITLP